MFGDAKPSKTNVIDKYLKWKGSEDDGFFAYREDGKDVRVDFKQGIVLREQFQIQGFDSQSNSWIQCNKISNTRDEKFQIRLGGAVIFDDHYNKETKATIEGMGYKLHLLLTVLADDGVIYELGFKGTGWGKYIELANDNETFKLKQLEPEKGKAGAIKYTSVQWAQGDTITEEEKQAALEIVKTINSAPVEEASGEEESINPEDIPF